MATHARPNPTEMVLRWLQVLAENDLRWCIGLGKLMKTLIVFLVVHRPQQLVTQRTRGHWPALRPAFIIANFAISQCQTK